MQHHHTYFDEGWHAEVIVEYDYQRAEPADYRTGYPGCEERADITDVTIRSFGVTVGLSDITVAIDDESRKLLEAAIQKQLEDDETLLWTLEAEARGRTAA